MTPTETTSLRTSCSLVLDAIENLDDAEQHAKDANSPHALEIRNLMEAARKLQAAMCSDVTIEDEATRMEAAAR